jgi:membrane protein involved in colicin uptake
VLDLAALKTPPGDYTLAFIGSAVAKYRYHPAAVPRAEEAQKKADQEATAAAAAAQKLAAEATAAPADKKAAAEAAARAAAEAQKVAEAAKQEAARRLQAATAAAAPKDVVEIVTSEPIRLKVTPKGKS